LTTSSGISGKRWNKQDDKAGIDFTSGESKIFSGPMPSQRSARQGKCLRAKPELLPWQRSEMLHGRKKLLSCGEINAGLALHEE
jgi:hypothetical protein